MRSNTNWSEIRILGNITQVSSQKVNEMGTGSSGMKMEISIEESMSKIKGVGKGSACLMMEELIMESGKMISSMVLELI